MTHPTPGKPTQTIGRTTLDEVREATNLPLSAMIKAAAFIRTFNFDDDVEAALCRMLPEVLRMTRRANRQPIRTNSNDGG